MNTLELKNNLDDLFSKINEPYGTTPQWHYPPLTPSEVENISERLNGRLPESVKGISLVFSGLVHNVYLVGEKSSGSETPLIVSHIRDVREWGGEELQDDKQGITLDGWDEISDEEIIGFPGFKRKAIYSEEFILIGFMGNGEIYMDLTGVTGAPAGSLVHIDNDYTNCFVRIISDDYPNFWLLIERSLRTQKQKDGDD